MNNCSTVQYLKHVVIDDGDLAVLAASTLRIIEDIEQGASGLINIGYLNELMNDYCDLSGISLNTILCISNSDCMICTMLTSFDNALHKSRIETHMGIR